MSEQRRPTRAVHVPSEADVYVKTSQATACPLGPIESQVLDRIDGRTPLSTLAKVLELSVHETAMVIARLIDLGAAERTADDVDGGWDAPATDAATAPPPKDRAR